MSEEFARAAVGKETPPSRCVECNAARGQFVPRLFGWMAHVYMFGGDDPRTIWGGEHADHMHMHH